MKNGINIDELARINRELNETAENEIEFSGISSLIVSSSQGWKGHLSIYGS